MRLREMHSIKDQGRHFIFILTIYIHVIYIQIHVTVAGDASLAYLSTRERIRLYGPEIERYLLFDAFLFYNL